MLSHCTPSRAPILYSFRRCPYAIRARLAIKVSGVRVALREVVLRDKPAALLLASAKATVPVLQLPDGRVLEQSLEIMRWALEQHDPQGWLHPREHEQARVLIALNDGRFKQALDRYKYATRHPELPPHAGRDEAVDLMLAPLNARLADHPFLLRDTPSLADMAIAPFVRQFAAVDPGWFDSAPFGPLQAWIKRIVLLRPVRFGDVEIRPLATRRYRHHFLTAAPCNPRRPFREPRLSTAGGLSASHASVVGRRARQGTRPAGRALKARRHRSLDSAVFAHEIRSSVRNTARPGSYQVALASRDLQLGHPAAALASLVQAKSFLATHNEPGLDRQRLHDETIALLALGRITEARVKLREVLDRYDRETGPNERIGALRDLGPALARAGDRAGALALYTREQLLLQAKSDGRYERDMQDVQKLIKDESERLQARRVAQWGGAAAACVLLALAIAFIARRQAARNRQLASRNDALQMQVEHDSLTGLANRAHLQARVAAAGEFFDGALFLVDVDHFKRINDRHGHAAGDHVLVEVARRLERVLRERDLVVRWGGEEFIVMVDAMPIAEAVVLVQRLMKTLEERPVVVEGESIGVSASIGFAVFPLAGQSTGVPFDAAFALVDAAMYHAKNQGRHCATCVLSIDPRLVLEQSSLPSALARAAAQGTCDPRGAPFDRACARLTRNAIEQNAFRGLCRFGASAVRVVAAAVSRA